MRLATWNVNGLRSVHSKGFLEWFDKQKIDIVCLQEIKAHREQVHPELWNPYKYSSHWHCAKKRGYSGLLIYSKEEPLNVICGLGNKEIDDEGRVLIAEYKDFVLINSYFPNSQREHERLPYKLGFCDAMLKKLNAIRKSGKNVILCGDFNIAHKEIDLKNPKTNKDNAGFLPEERAWFDKLVGAGYVDTFREFNKEGDNYTWWSYRPTIRERNIGWRLDYFVCNPEMKDRLKKVEHQTKTLGSDHCPVLLELKQ